MIAPSMTASEKELWTRIENFPLDEAEVVLPFSARLARENGWSRAYTLRVMGEYRRFLFLSSCAGHPVSPSDAVDQAWHLHLVYTKSYWKDLCGQVLGRPLHHEPTQGGMAEGAKHHDWYARTLASYRRFFGEPPKDVWPPVEERFQPKQEQWVDVSRHWLVPRPMFLRRMKPLLVAGAGASVLLACLLPGCSLTSIFDAKGPDFLFYYFLGFLAALMISLVLPRFLMKDETAYHTEALADPYDIAFLGAGVTRALDAALAALFSRQAVEVRKDKNGSTMIQAKSAQDQPQWHFVERLVYGALSKDKEASFLQLRKAVTPALESIREKLQKAGLLMSDSQRRTQMFLAAVPFVLLLAAGVIKIFIGVSRNKPVFFLVIFCIATLVAMAVRLGRMNRRSAVGEWTWQKLQGSRKPDIVVDGKELAPMAVALMGTSALMAPGFYPLHSALQRPNGTTSGCGSGCGGSSGCGGGSGCGGSGCGGCGGGGD